MSDKPLSAAILNGGSAIRSLRVRPPLPPSSRRAARALLEADLDEHLWVIEALRTPSVLAAVSASVDVLLAVYAVGGKAIFFGNGGSAADSTHLAAEMLGRFLRERRPLAALALADNHSAVTAIGNDYGYGQTFSRQIEALAGPGDVAVGFSTSGSSANVAEALVMATTRDVRTIAFTGVDPGRVGEAAEVVVAVPSSATPRIQEAHMLIGHILCDRVERMITS
jgi:D-sedoheptulose 7-phosphate isomerase